MNPTPAMSVLPRRLYGLISRFLLAAVLAWALPVWAADQFLPPEQAFAVSARMVAPQRVEVLVRITSGYYVYREPFRFSAEGATLGPAELPAGQVKFDNNFQKNVETYRGELRIALPLAQSGGPFKLKVVTQGCADAGLCYPPMSTELRLDPAGVAGDQTLAPRQPDTGLLEADGAIVDRMLRAGRLLPVLGLFFGLGLLLSLTPCVLPMLPILSSLILGSGERPSRWRGLALASAYSLGMALVYTALGLAAGLAGEGFAAALQTPWAIGAFSALLAFFALSMFDVYELRLPARFTGHMSGHANRLPAGQFAGVFVMGGVSALIVSPCVTAPLAGALLFISQTGDVALGGAALFAMAAGMSVPLLLLGVSAGQWLPKAGAWMQSVKQLFGVMMLGVALWVARPVLPAALVMLLWGLVLLLSGFLLQPFSPLTHHRHVFRVALQRSLGVAALTLGVMQMVGAGSGGQDPLRPLGEFTGSAADARPALVFQVVQSEAALDAALQSAAGRPVMLDFYADWCVSCKEMDRTTFKDSKVVARLGQALLLKADVTANTESQRVLLRRFKLFGPPGTLFFDAQGREIVAARVMGFQDARRFEDTLSQAGL